MICYQVSANMMNRKQTFCILGLLYFLWQINMSMCSSNPQIIGGPLPPNFNATLAELEKGYVKWVSFVGSLRHSVYVSARNQLAPCNVLVVDKTRRYGTYFRVQDAVDAIPLFNFQRVVIFIRAGTYREKVMVPALKPFITFQGEGMDKTIITWDDTANKLGPDGKPIGTFNTATVAINSAYFVARNITFQNSAPAPPPGAVGRQAVALRISGDTAAFYGCHFLGAQDTLYDHFGRHYFKDCYIEGSVDFVFGNALSLYEQCHLHAISQNVYGALTAQRRSNLLDDTGFSFVNCKVTGSGALYLGRAWGSFSRVVFAYTYMDPVVIPKGWYDWGDPSREQTVFYGEYRCYGPGANYQGRVAWARDLKYEEVKPFLQISLIDGPEWLDS